MNSGLKKTLAGFISQRIEMGETEWHAGKTCFEKITSLKNCLEDKKSTLKQEISEKQVSSFLNKSSSDDQIKNQSQRPKTLIVPENDKIVCNPETVNPEAISRAETIDELDRTVCGCLRCRLGYTRTKFVFGSGNPNADIMFIGEAPGADEDMQGKPFVGRAGQLLTKMIEAINFKREDVYIGNVLKCRPPGNRDPKPDEVEACEPILIRQLDIIKPKFICALGRISGQTLLRTQANLGSLRGKFHDYHGIKLLVTYHPAALLRNPNWKPGAWEDLKFLRREYDSLES